MKSIKSAADDLIHKMCLSLNLSGHTVSLWTLSPGSNPGQTEGLSVRSFHILGFFQVTLVSSHSPTHACLGGLESFNCVWVSEWKLHKNLKFIMFLYHLS